MQTRSGIELDLKESKYQVLSNDIIFYFSSKFYKNKFRQELKKFVEAENLKINTRYKINIDLTKYLLLSLYVRIEKRGFLIFDGKKLIYYDDKVKFTSEIE